MKKILLVLVGGTICTAVNDRGTLSVSEHAGAMLKENFLKSDSALLMMWRLTLPKICIFSAKT